MPGTPSNDFYTRSADFVRLTRASGPEVRSEFDNVQVAFDNVETETNKKVEGPSGDETGWALPTPVAGRALQFNSGADGLEASSIAIDDVVTDAEAARDAAQTAQTAAETAQTAAELAETNAAASEAKAEDWAEELEDVEVETGKYSALHHAAKAATSAASVTLPNTPSDGDILEFDSGAGAYAGRQPTAFFSDRTLTDPIIAGSITEEVFALSGTTPAIDPTNGAIQTWTLSGSSTPTESLAAGESVTLMIDDGSANTITWTSAVDQWIGGSAPSLATTGYTIIELWKVGTTVYGALVGDAS